MNLSLPIIQFGAWLLALICSILGLYILLLNFRHTANRHVSGFMLLLALTNFAIGMIVGSAEASQSTLAVLLLAATAPAIGPYRVIVALILIRPQWLRGRLRWLWRAFYGLTLLPALLTLSDAALGTRLWLSGLDPISNASGLRRLPDYVSGTLGRPLLILNCGITPWIMAGVLIYILLRREEVKQLTYRLARMLLIGLIVSGVVMISPGMVPGALGTIAITSAIFTGVYAYAAFRQMISGRQLQRGRLQPRLTALVLVTTVPILIAMVLFVTDRAGDIIQQRALDRIEATNQALGTSVAMWLDLNANALQELVADPDIISMDPERQEPLLEIMEEAYPHMYLVSTTDRRGYNVARSDDQPLQDYRQELWQIGARNGVLTLDVFVDSTTGQPALAMSLPIQRDTGTIDGVAMFASRLNDVAEEVRASRVGETGVAFVVDGQNRIVAHTTPQLSAELQDFDYYPPVRALRTGEQNPIIFTDDEGTRWWAHVDELDNGWGVVIQQQESELTAAVRHFRQVSWPLLAVGTMMLLVMVALTIRQALRPIATLTETATAIAAGDLTRTAPVVSEDELGTLARAFNSMTEQLRRLIGELEQRVAERTFDLRRRSRYLETTATVAREAASELDPQRLLTGVANLISEQFDFYHVGLFLLDSTERWAVLQAASSEGGQRMLARGHRLRVGQMGIVGYVTARGEPRIVLDVEEDAIYFDNPDLPDTHSEMALPLRARGEVIGALDVQSRRPGAFSEEDIDVMQTLADQVAVAISNAQLFQQMQDALIAERRAYGELSREAWRKLLNAQSELGARYDPQGLLTSDGQLRATMRRAMEEGKAVSGEPGAMPTLSVPLKIRDQTIGVLNVQKPTSEDEWGEGEVDVLEALADQLAQALESARLYDDTQRRATREQLTRQITDRMRRSPDIEEIVQTTVDELFSALGTSRTFVELRLASPKDDGRDDR